MKEHYKEDIVAELIADGYKARISTTGWLLVSGKRVLWEEGYWMAYLGWKLGSRPPRIERTFYAPEAA